MDCTVCGDPAIGFCKRKHREVIVIPLGEIKKGDLLLRPSVNGKRYEMFAVEKIRPQRADGSIVIQTAQKLILMLFPELPILVKREVECGWPICDLHCGKCERYAEEERQRAELLQMGSMVHKKKRKQKAAEVGLSEESPIVRQSERITERRARTGRPIHSE